MSKLDPYASGVLKPEHHDRLVANLDNFARDAGVQPFWICTSIHDVCAPEVVEYILNYRIHKDGRESAGICFTGPDEKGEVAWHMSAMTGMLVRNFIRARVQMLGSVLDDLASKDLPDLDCLMIPNFFHPADSGGHIAKWQISALFDLLMHRHSMGLMTMLYVADLKKLETEYGEGVARLIDNHFTKMKI